MAYIYLIYNDINTKVYIGKTNFSIQKRFSEHISDSKRERIAKRPLYNAMNKYGIEHFFVKELEEVDVDSAAEREQYWISFYDSYYHGYNATLGGDGTSYLDYRRILDLYDEGRLTQQDIAKECSCSPDSVAHIVYQYREDVTWRHREQYDRKCHRLHPPKQVRCVETQQEFPSCLAAADWLISEHRINSRKYGSAKIPEACRHIRGTIGGYHWEFV